MLFGKHVFSKPNFSQMKFFQVERKPVQSFPLSYFPIFRSETGTPVNIQDGEICNNTLEFLAVDYCCKVSHLWCLWRCL